MIEVLYLRSIELPSTVHAITVIDPDGSFNIYINASLERERKEKAWAHEYCHIKKNHFYDFEPVIVNEIEAENV